MAASRKPTRPFAPHDKISPLGAFSHTTSPLGPSTPQIYLTPSYLTFLVPLHEAH